MDGSISILTLQWFRAISLSEYRDVPGISIERISEVTAAGARCGWMEYYNRDRAKTSYRFFVGRLDDA